jgi:hypothetical protein
MSSQTPESSLGLKNTSQQFRDNILKLNLKTPPDIVLGLVSTEGLGALQAYEYSLGRDTVIDNFSVKNPGDITSEADKVRNKILNRNRPLNKSDFSAISEGNDSLGYTYQALADGIGKLAVISDYSIPTLQSVSSLYDLSSDYSLKLNANLNKYIPQTFDVFNTNTLKPNAPQTPYVDDNGQLSRDYYVTQYTPQDILGINVNKNSAIDFTIDPVSYINYSGKVLQNETLLMNIAALELKSAFETRIQQNILSDSPLTNINDALADPAQAINILKDPSNNLIAKNYNITVPNNPIGNAALFTSSLVGSTDIITYLNLKSKPTLTPGCFNTADQSASTTDKSALGKLLNDAFGKSKQGYDNSEDVAFLSNTGSGQKFQLFSNIYFNKYAPNYDPQYQSGIFQAIDKTLQAIGGVTGFLGMIGGKRPQSRYYFGDINSAPFFALQDSEGDQVKSPEEITKIISTNYLDGTTYYEPGLNETAKYGSLNTDFIWHKTDYQETFYDPQTVSSDSKGNINYNTVSKIDSNNNDAERILSKAGSDNYYDRFRECSILFKTQRLLEKADDNSNPINLVIDQTKTKLFDGYSLYSKGSGVLATAKTQRIDDAGNVIGNNYSVPGLYNGTRDNVNNMRNNAEFCRTWTKVRPYSGTLNLMRFTELLRLERNSVLDRYNNYSIFPSETNINYTKSDKSTGNAKKYMFSIENLAWRGQNKWKGDYDLKPFEVGPNGGRIMWFPPYDIKFTDDTTVNWTSHQFLGRPEPIYTYNNTERQGNLSFKIVVDHPSILNILTQKELKNYPDTVVDEILDSFWAGCTNFDIFELARIWGVFSNNDIAYFERVIGEIQTTKANADIKSKLDQSDAKEPTAQVTQDTTTLPIIPNIQADLFFENQTPLDTEDANVNTYDTYFDTYYKLSIADPSVQSAESKKGKSYANLVKYDQVIGSNSEDGYFSQLPKGSAPYYQLYQSYTNFRDQINNYANNRGNNITITVNSFTSALDSQDVDFNTKLGIRRFKSVIKWLAFNIFKDLTVETTNDVLTPDNIEKYLTGTKVSFVRPSNGENKKDKVIFVLNPPTQISAIDSMKAVSTPENVLTASFTTIPMVRIPYGKAPNTVTYYCTDTEDNRKLLLTSINYGYINTAEGNTYNLTSDFVGCLQPKIQSYSQADIVCSVLSIQASYSRKVNIKVSLEVNPDPPKTETKTNANPTQVSSQQPTNATNITKREIAQRILNRLITEADYFEYLQANTPTVYNSVKEKLKYFTPAFHSMTPEGLNSRLTFLQQCLRPGDTILNSQNESCDATNTAFGKPPICVLRIGDFYNTKILINSCNISYEPLVFDLNPEGIGVQPMIANVSLSFKYIGGSGLRVPINELQNALSFNYYANADVYDSRTSANIDPVESQLVNQETSFFDNNTLDLIPIVQKAKEYQIPDSTYDVPKGTIGVPDTTTKDLIDLSGNNYSLAKSVGIIYDSSIVFQPYAFSYDPTENPGIYGQNYYQRLFDDKVNNNAQLNVAGKPLTDTTAWTLLTDTNFGEASYISEYGQNASIEIFNINYKKLFTNFYDSFITNVLNYSDSLVFDSSNQSSFLLSKLLNVDYVGKVDNDDKTFMDNIINNIVTGGTIDSTTVNSYFGTKAKYSNYVNIKDFHDYSQYGGTSFNNIYGTQLHLYPQMLYYTTPRFNPTAKISSVFTGQSYNPGYMTDGEYDSSDVAGLYLKKPTNYDYTRALITHFNIDITNKLYNDLLVYWFIDTGLFDRYNKELNSKDLKIIFQNYISTQLNSYTISLLLTKQQKNIDQTNNIYSFNTYFSGINAVLSGYDGTTTNSKVNQLYEIIRNENKIKTPVSQLFGYDPFSQYLTIYDYTGSTNNDISKGKPINLGDVFNISSNPNNQFLFGNGYYYFRQISNQSSFINSSLLLNNTNFDNIDSKMVLPKSDDLDTPKTTTGDTTNYELKSFDNTITTPQIQFDSQTNVVDYQFQGLIPSLKNVNSQGTYLQNKYQLTYVFEKLSHEFLEFSNKTLGLILNDYSQNYQITIKSTQDSLKVRMEKNTPSVTEDLYNLLFPANSTANGASPYDYYNVISVNSNDSEFNTNVNNLSSALNYTISLTDSYIDYILSGTTPDITTKMNLNSLKGQVNGYLMSSLSEANMMDFFNTLFVNKDTHVNAMMTSYTTNINKLDLTDKQKSKKLDNIKKILNDFFNNVDKYNQSILTEFNNLNAVYLNKLTAPYTTYANTAFNSLANSNPSTPQKLKLSSATMLKGSDLDYSVKVRLKNYSQINTKINSSINNSPSGTTINAINNATNNILTYQYSSIVPPVK